MKKTAPFLLAASAFAFTLIGCGNSADSPSASGTNSGDASSKLTGSIHVDGSSTVFPISQAVAEEFMKTHPDVNVTVNLSGTGGGMKKFSAKELEITNASRPIKAEEAEACKKNGVEFIELPVAFDGLTVVINPSNDFASNLTVEELKSIWAPDSKINNWKDVRPGFPDLPIKLFGPGQDSGTFDYFTEAINGKTGASRPDYTASEDDNVLVNGVEGEKGALGYFGYSYYVVNKDKLRAVTVNGVAPSDATINDGTYTPLSRPLMIYVRKDAIERPEVKAFVNYYLGPEGRSLAESVGYVKLSDEAYRLVQERADSLKVGTSFGEHSVGVKIEDLLKQEEIKQ